MPSKLMLATLGFSIGSLQLLRQVVEPLHSCMRYTALVRLCSGIAVEWLKEISATMRLDFVQKDVHPETDLTAVYVLWAIYHHNEDPFVCNVHRTDGVCLQETRTNTNVSIQHTIMECIYIYTLPFLRWHVRHRMVPFAP